MSNCPTRTHPDSNAILLVLLCCLSGCSHIRVVAFDKQANTVSVQAGRWASQEEVQKEAEGYCNGPVALLKMGESIVGTSTSANAQAYGTSAYGSAVTTGIRRRVYTYACQR